MHLAAEVGLDVGAFLEAIGNGTAERVSAADQRLMRSYGSKRLPAFLPYRGKEGLLPGWQSLSGLHRILAASADGDVQPLPVDSTNDDAMAFIANHSRVAPIEVSTALNLSTPATEKVVDRLNTAGRLTRIEVGNGSVVRLAPMNLACDPVAGSASPQRHPTEPQRRSTRTQPWEKESSGLVPVPLTTRTVAATLAIASRIGDAGCRS